MTTRAPLPFVVRLLGAFAGALVVVFALTAVSASLIRAWDQRDAGDVDTLVAHPVSSLSGYSSLDLAELLGEPRHALPPPPVAPPLPPPVAPRSVRGFVMLEVQVDTTGRAISARIVDAKPQGLYEREAYQEAMAGDYPSQQPGVHDALIRFAVPVKAP